MTSKDGLCSSLRFESDRPIDNSACPAYPLNTVDRVRLNQIVRHRVRNLCHGTLMILDVMKARMPDSLSEAIDWDGLSSEVRNMQTFSQRLDLIIEPLPTARPGLFGDVLALARDRFVERFPFCNLDVDGPGDGVDVHAANWYSLLLDELLTNAGRIAGANGRVEIAWATKPCLQLVIVNTGAPFPDAIPVAPPVPFCTTAPSRDGLGLAIAYRICLALDKTLTVRSDMPGTTAVVIGPRA